MQTVGRTSVWSWRCCTCAHVPCDQTQSHTHHCHHDTEHFSVLCDTGTRDVTRALTSALEIACGQMEISHFSDDDTDDDIAGLDLDQIEAQALCTPATATGKRKVQESSGESHMTFGSGSTPTDDTAKKTKTKTAKRPRDSSSPPDKDSGAGPGQARTQSQRGHAGASASSSGTMPGCGQSEKRLYAKNRAVDIFNCMRKNTTHDDNPRMDFTPSTALEMQEYMCSKKPFERFAYYLTDPDDGYKIKDGVDTDGKPKWRNMLAASCLNTLRDLMQSVKTTYDQTRSPNSQKFLLCLVQVRFIILVHLHVCTLCTFVRHTPRSLHSSSLCMCTFVRCARLYATPLAPFTHDMTLQDSGPENDWWKQLRKNVRMKLCKMHTENGVSDDRSALPLYPDPHISKMVQSLLRHGTRDSLERAFALLTSFMVIQPHHHTHTHTQRACACTHTLARIDLTYLSRSLPLPLSLPPSSLCARFVTRVSTCLLSHTHCERAHLSALSHT